MKAKLVRENLSEGWNDRGPDYDKPAEGDDKYKFSYKIDLDIVRDFLTSGDAYQPAPSKYDPDQQTYFIPHLSSEDKVFSFTVVGGSDVYSIEAIDANGILYSEGEEISAGGLELEEIEEKIQDMFPKPPTGMKPWLYFDSTQEYLDFLTVYDQEKLEG